jgi:hypothetical protein
MQLEELIEKLQAIVKVHPNASVQIGIPNRPPQGDQLVEISELHYEHLGKRVVIEL